MKVRDRAAEGWGEKKAEQRRGGKGTGQQRKKKEEKVQNELRSAEKRSAKLRRGV